MAEAAQGRGNTVNEVVTGTPDFNLWGEGYRRINWTSEMVYLSVAAAQAKFNIIPIFQPEGEDTYKGMCYYLVQHNTVPYVANTVCSRRAWEAHEQNANLNPAPVESISVAMYRILVNKGVMAARPGIAHELTAGREEFAPQAPRVLPTPNLLDEMYDRFIRSNASAGFLVGREISPARVLSMFLIIPGFVDSYIAYVNNPDDGVEQVALLNQAEMYPAFQAGAPIHPSYTKSLAYALIFMVGLALGKGMTNAEQYRLVIQNRVSALVYETKDPTLTPAEIRRHIPLAHWRQINSWGTFFPRLKQMIYSVILSDLNPYHQHFRLIYSQLQMSAFALIAQFIDTPIRTAAHIDPTIISEMLKAIPVLMSLRNKYGQDNWRYYKVFEPEGRMVVNRQWTHLSLAALTFAIGEGHSTYARMKQASEITAHIAELVSKRLKPAYVRIAYAGLVTQEKYDMITNFLGIHQVPMANIDNEDLYQVQLTMERNILERVAEADRARRGVGRAVRQPDQPQNVEEEEGEE